MVPAVAKSVESCGTKFVSAWRCENGVTKYIAFKLRCKSWECPTCRKRKSRFYKHIIKSLFDGKQLYLYTLTYFHNRDEREAWRTYNESWNRLRTTATQRYGKFRYVRVLECHKSSNFPHIHVITDCYIPPNDFGKLALASGFGWSNDWKRIDSCGAAAYVSKYLTKEWPREDSVAMRREYKLRIITMSVGLMEKPPRLNPWKILCRMSSWAHCLDSLRTELEFQTAGTSLCQVPAEETEFICIEVVGAPSWMIEAAKMEEDLYCHHMPVPRKVVECSQETLFPWWL